MKPFRLVLKALGHSFTHFRGPGTTEMNPALEYPLHNATWEQHKWGFKPKP